MKKGKIVLIGVGIVIVTVLLVAFGQPRLKRHLESTECVRQMSSICLAARIYASDNTNNLPRDFSAFSSELCIPQILHCPSDRLRKFTTNWGLFTLAKSSYSIESTGQCDDLKNTVFLRCLIHGHSGYADGTVPMVGRTGRQTKPIL